MRKWTGSCASAAEIAWALAATSVQAQAGSAASPSSESAASGGRLEEIIVTGRKRAENIQTVPLSVSAFSSDILKAAHADDVSSLQGL